MLTKHNYKSLANNWDDPKVKECCGKSDPGTPGCNDCCYDTWSDELKEINKKYAEVKEDADQVEKRLTLLVDRRNRYKTWKDELDKGEDLARSICHQLEIMAGQAEKIWFNSCKAAEAIRILFCMIKDFYVRIDYLKIRYDELQNCINHNNNPALVKGKGILACLEEYRTRLDVMVKTRDEVVKAMLEAVKLSELIRNSMSTRCCPDNSGSYDPCKSGEPCSCSETGEKPAYGFKTILCEWYCAFGCDEECTDCSEAPQQNQGGQPEKRTAAANDDCGPQPLPDPCAQEECELEPMFTFPICNNRYKCDVDDWYNKDVECVKELEQELKKKLKQKEALQACQTSLRNAIKEVDPKLICKN